MDETRSPRPPQCDLDVHRDRGRSDRATATIATGRQRQQERLLEVGGLVRHQADRAL